jgi:hypothetical protein
MIHKCMYLLIKRLRKRNLLIRSRCSSPKNDSDRYNRMHLLYAALEDFLHKIRQQFSRIHAKIIFNKFFCQ